MVEILRLAGAQDERHELVHVCEVPELLRDAADTTWIPFVAKQGWTAISIDRAMRRRPHERVALATTQLRLVLISHGFSAIGRWEQARHMLHSWPRIVAATARCAAGECFNVAMNGKVERRPLK